MEDHKMQINNEEIDFDELSFLIPNNSTNEELELLLAKELDNFIIFDKIEADNNTKWLFKNIEDRESKNSISITTSSELKNAA